MILEGEIKDAKNEQLFSLISKHSLNITFLCIFFMLHVPLHITRVIDVGGVSLMKY